MSSETVYMICGRKLVLPATPEKIEVNWERKDTPTKGHRKDTRASESHHDTAKVVAPSKKRLRRKKKPKT
jgi:hypothetical protein